MPRYSTQHYNTLTNYTTPQLKQQLQLQYAKYITLQLQLTTTTYNYNSTTLQLQLHLQIQLHYTTLHPAVVVRWPLQPLQPLQKTQLQPPVGPSVDSLCHGWVTTTNPSYRFPIFKTSAAALCGTTGITYTIDYYILQSSTAKTEQQIRSIIGALDSDDCEMIESL